MLIFIKGAGDLATGVAWRLHNCGFQVVMTDIARPTASDGSSSRKSYHGSSRTLSARRRPCRTAR